jgi:hypothetical protein
MWFSHVYTYTSCWYGTLRVLPGDAAGPPCPTTVSRFPFWKPGKGRDTPLKHVRTHQSCNFAESCTGPKALETFYGFVAESGLEIRNWCLQTILIRYPDHLPKIEASHHIRVHRNWLWRLAALWKRQLEPKEGEGKLSRRVKPSCVKVKCRKTGFCEFVNIPRKKTCWFWSCRNQIAWLLEKLVMLILSWFCWRSDPDTC